MTLDTANQRSVDKRNKDLRKQQLVADEAVKWIMGDSKGRAYLADLIRDSQALLPVVSASNDGAMFREGRKVIGHKIMADVQRTCPKQFPALIAAVFEQPHEDTDGGQSDDE